MKTFLHASLLLIVLAAAPVVLAHGRSQEMIRELNAAAPGWLSIGAPIKAEVAPDTAGQSVAAFHSRSGGTTNSRNRVQIPSRGIEIQVAYEIDWTGNNADGAGSSLSPDGTRLIVNSGPSSHLYEIMQDGSFREVPIQLPHVTYDEGRKGYLTEWSWADNQTLVGRSEVTDDGGHEVLENRLYVYDMPAAVLRRLDLSALNLPASAGLKLSQIGGDLKHLKVVVGGREITVKADLKSPPKIEKQKPAAAAKALAPPLVAPPGPSSKPLHPTHTLPKAAPVSSTARLLWMGLIVGVLAVLGLAIKKKR